jgi:hypothetical protein
MRNGDDIDFDRVKDGNSALRRHPRNVCVRRRRINERSFIRWIVRRLFYRIGVWLRIALWISAGLDRFGRARRKRFLGHAGIPLQLYHALPTQLSQGGRILRPRFTKGYEGARALEVSFWPSLQRVLWGSA